MWYHLKRSRVRRYVVGVTDGLKVEAGSSFLMDRLTAETRQETQRTVMFVN